MGFPIVNTENVTVKQCKHGDFAYLKSDTVIGKSLDTYGEYAEAELALASQLLRPGDGRRDRAACCWLPEPTCA